jgi:small subunit ribosomal protein S19
MSRSLIKGPYLTEGVLRALKRFEKTKQMIKIWDRSCVIISSFVGKTVHVYNGRKFIPISISEVHVGHKFGEFSPTRVQAKHAGKNKKK